MTDNIKAFDMPPEQEAAWEAAYSQARKENEAGNSDAAIAAARKAWELIPEPRNQCSVSHITLVRLVKLYISAKRYGEAVSLSDQILATSPFKRNDVPVFSVHKGIALYEAGDTKAAWSAFDAAWKDSKDFGFKGEDRKYLDFYLAK
jgi:tetratricopeptide (TPR) repeat protein